MTISILICDDLPEERANLLHMLQKYKTERGVSMRLETAADGTELLSLWRPKRWDLIFLDIYMPYLNGVDAARRLREVDRQCEIVFATTSREHGMEGHELHAMDYLTKPFLQRDVDEVMDWFLRKHADQFNELTLRTELGSISLRAQDVLYIESRGRTCILHLRGREINVQSSMNDLTGGLNDAAFFHCHKSFMVNLAHTVAIEKRAFRMDDGSSVPISAANLARSRDALSAWQT